jgi:DNA gyrase subunit A
MPQDRHRDDEIVAEQQPIELEEAETELGGGGAISEEQFADLEEREEFLLSVTEKGFGVRSSAYGYPSPAAAARASTTWI